MIWDVHPGYRIQIFLIRKTAVVIPGWADAGSDTRFQYSTHASVKVVNTQCCRAEFGLRRGIKYNCLQWCSVAVPGCLSRIPDPNYSIQDQKDSGSATKNFLYF
jgi:hypothetical protein